MNKFVVLFLLCVSFVVGRLQGNEADSVILKFDNEPFSGNLNDPQVYKYSFKTSNQIEAEQTATRDADGNLIIEGFYSYVDPVEGIKEVSYIADTNGYRLKTIKPLIVKDSVNTRIAPVVLNSLGGGIG